MNLSPDRVQNISVSEADQLIQARVSPLAPEERPLNGLLGAVLAMDINADRDQPPWRQSAMDGFAVRSSDTQGALEESVELTLSAEVAAGGLPRVPVIRGQACRIMTGAPVPEGADSVIPIEKTRDGGKTVIILKPVSRGENIRPQGDDYKRDQVILRKGLVLNPASIGLLAASGRTKASVYRAPRVAIVATGAELVEPGETIGLENIRNSNSYALEVAVREAGGAAVLMGIAPDSPEGVRDLLGRCGDTDMILVSGGVSVGAYDYVKGVLDEMGAKRVFWRVAIKPGGPLAFWMLDKTLIFGLPGNPVSALVCFEEFVRPALRKMVGHRVLGRPLIQAVLKEDFTKRAGKMVFARAVISREGEGFVARPLGNQSSGALAAMAHANGFIVFPSGSGPVKAGAVVQVRLLDDQDWWIQSDPRGVRNFWIRETEG